MSRSGFGVRQPKGDVPGAPGPGMFHLQQLYRQCSARGTRLAFSCGAGGADVLRVPAHQPAETGFPGHTSSGASSWPTGAGARSTALPLAGISHRSPHEPPAPRDSLSRAQQDHRARPHQEADKQEAPAGRWGGHLEANHMHTWGSCKISTSRQTAELFLSGRERQHFPNRSRVVTQHV